MDTKEQKILKNVHNLKNIYDTPSDGKTMVAICCSSASDGENPDVLLIFNRNAKPKTIKLPGSIRYSYYTLVDRGKTLIVRKHIGDTTLQFYKIDPVLGRIQRVKEIDMSKYGMNDIFGITIISGSLGPNFAMVGPRYKYIYTYRQEPDEKYSIERYKINDTAFWSYSRYISPDKILSYSGKGLNLFYIFNIMTGTIQEKKYPELLHEGHKTVNAIQYGRGPWVVGPAKDDGSVMVQNVEDGKKRFYNLGKRYNKYKYSSMLKLLVGMDRTRGEDGKTSMIDLCYQYLNGDPNTEQVEIQDDHDDIEDWLEWWLVGNVSVFSTFTKVSIYRHNTVREGVKAMKEHLAWRYNLLENIKKSCAQKKHHQKLLREFDKKHKFSKRIKKGTYFDRNVLDVISEY